MSRNAFGPNLRRVRLQHGVTLEQIAKRTNLARELFDALERNDFARWPTGIYARAYVRQYAYAIGVDPDSTVDEFCRWFDHGDRRAERIVREHSTIVGHTLAWQDDVPESAADGNRRAGSGSSIATVGQPAPRPASGSIFMRLKRALGRT